MSDHASDQVDGDDEAFLTDRFKLGAAIALFGVLAPGITDYALTALGAPGLGAGVWAIGYATTVVVLFVLFIRPLDIGAER
ncbi:hypothetical protein [Halomarina ordinaria]|uniref:Uncharacterized protein n=1 Tax=Halomarina ordinaria TaxID=3033939 RepID=A0ABD5UFP1_9EURY|nr:hypothetical protein [Halomarina sp. PSRA2]